MEIIVLRILIWYVINTMEEKGSWLCYRNPIIMYNFSAIMTHFFITSNRTLVSEDSDSVALGWI